MIRSGQDVWGTGPVQAAVPLPPGSAQRLCGLAGLAATGRGTRVLEVLKSGLHHPLKGDEPDEGRRRGGE